MKEIIQKYMIMPYSHTGLHPFFNKQDLGTILKCYSLYSSFKILLCRFFLMKFYHVDFFSWDRSVFFS